MVYLAAKDDYTCMSSHSREHEAMVECKTWIDDGFTAYVDVIALPSDWSSAFRKGMLGWKNE
jgi:hypothetical protein